MSGVRLNILCLVGAVVGVIAVFSTWMTLGFGFSTREMNLIDIYTEVRSSSDFWLPAVLCLIGAAVSFISPLGGVLQIVGAPLYVAVFMSTSDPRLPSGIGPYLALAGAIIVLASLVYPVGPGYRIKPVGVTGRLLTISPESRLSQQPPAQAPQSPPPQAR